MLLNRGRRHARAEARLWHRVGPVAVAAGDLDGDGRPDLVTANTSGSVSVLLNRGDGTFRAKADYAAGGAPNSVTLADFDGDGFLDAAVASPRAPKGRNVTVLLGRGDGTFRLRRYFAARVNASRIASGDLNGDGRPELVFSDGRSLAVMLNRGDATFQGPLWYGFADTLAAGDFNGDGRLDLAGAWVNDRNGDWNETVHRNRSGLCNVQDARGQDPRRGDRPAQPRLVLASVRFGALARARCAAAASSRSRRRFPAVLAGGGKVSLVLSLGR